MFRKPISLSSILSLASFPLLAAEPAGEYLHRGAQQYIFGDKAKAESEVAAGLGHYPQDEPLQKLLALLKKEQKDDQQKSEDQKQQDQQQKQDEQKDKQSQTQDQQQQQQQDGKKPDQKQDAQPQSGRDGSPDQQQKQKQDSQSADGRDGKNAPKPEPMPGQENRKLDGDVKANQAPGAVETPEQKQAAEAMAEMEAAAANEMTQRQARALLESLRSEDEKVRLLDPNERKRSGRVVRDW